MKKFLFACAAMFVGSAVSAENLAGVTELLCSTGQAQICFETGECFEQAPWELNMPDFVVIDTKKKTMRTTKASAQNRSTALTSVTIDDRAITLQGVETWAFSIVIDIVTGRLTGAIAGDGASVTTFGACTSTKM